MNDLSAAFQEADDRRAVERRLAELGWTADCTKVLTHTERTALVEYRCGQGQHVSYVLIDLATGESLVVDEEVEL